MRHTTIWAGIIGGVLCSAALIVPLYGAIPGRYISTWWQPNEGTALAGWITAAVICFLLTVVAALADREHPLFAGGQAGALMGLVASSFVLQPAVSISCVGELLRVRTSNNAKAEALQELINTTLPEIHWFNAWTGVICIFSMLIIGLFSAILLELALSTSLREPPQRIRGGVPVLLAILVTILPGFLLLHEAKTPTFPDWISTLKVDSTHLLGGAMISIVMGLLAYEVMFLFQKKKKMRAGIRALFAAIVLLLLSTPLFINYHALNSVPLAIGVASLPLAMLVGAISGYRSVDELDRSRPTFMDVLGDATLAGMMVTCLGLFLGGGALADQLALVEPFSLALSSDLPIPSATQLVQNTFIGRFAFAGVGFAATAIYMFVALPLWGIDAWRHRA